MCTCIHGTRASAEIVVMKRARTGRWTSLNAESLEVRAMMAGNVTAEVWTDGFSERHLRITGDDLGNRFFVEQLVLPAGFQVVPINSDTDYTTVNGFGSGAFFGSITGIVSISLNGGNDYVRVGPTPDPRYPLDPPIRSVLPEDLIILGGSGKDTVDVQWLTLADASSNVQISGQDGNDTIRMQQVSCQRNIDVFTDGGNDVVIVQNTDIEGSLFLRAGVGNDRLTVSSVRVGRDLRAEMGTGNDIVSVRMSQFFAAFVNGGLGTDTLNRKGNSRVIGRTFVERLTAN